MTPTAQRRRMTCAYIARCERVQPEKEKDPDKLITCGLKV